MTITTGNVPKTLTGDRMSKLTTAGRKRLPAADFAGPDRSYPINDASHARNALARVSQHGSSAEKARVRSKVRAKFPGIAQAHHNDGGHAHHNGRATAHR